MPTFSNTFSLVIDNHIQVPMIKNAVEEHEAAEDLLKVPFLAHVLRRVLPHLVPANMRRRQPPRRRLNVNLTSLNRIDIAVLLPENQARTRVTPLIESLAAPYFQDFSVVGPQPPRPDRKLLQKQKRLASSRLRTLVEKCWKSRRTVSFTREQRLSPRSNWLQAVSIDGEQYEVIIVQR
jgi:hypothetical protein